MSPVFLRTTRKSLILAKRVGVLFCAGVNVVACTEGVRALPSLARSPTLSLPRVFDSGAGVCVCLCAFMPACAGAVAPRSAVATPTPRREGESPILATRVDVLCCAAVNVVARTESTRALPSVARSLTLSPPRVFDNGAGVCVCLCAFMPACACAVTPRSAVAPTTSRAASESPILAKRF